ncbi:putative phosphoesterase, SbcD/Mre11-related protein [Aciduliprofundum sp. MAR08-339]|uniref:metallophosphoesterase n=1 Tax=Aciduliprofundum sp. (strain MAR08-339) TaxID=673860 RepID=UPI0002A4B860|nr:putative phosphoesterase, SbcD/Mre11-related protein [Aciduliprofundum sp. MAR08-339]
MKVDRDRAIYLEDINSLVIADLHIGYEDELRERGIIVPSIWRSMKRRIITLMERYGAEQLIILGDVKHSILRTPRELSMFFQDLPYAITAVKGNHDGGIEDMVDFEIKPATGFRMGKYGFIHGHSWPGEGVMTADILFMGHIHPEMEFFDSVSKSTKMPCLLRGNLSDRGVEKYGKNVKIVVLPAFNPLVGAAIGKPIGPLFRNKLVGEMEVYLLNGTYLGKYNMNQP